MINLASSLIVWLQVPRPAALRIFKVSRGWSRRGETKPPDDGHYYGGDYDDDDDNSDT